MTRALTVACALLLATLALCGSLWRRDIADLATARAEARQAQAASVAQAKRASKCLAMVDAERAAAVLCRREAADAASEAREVERRACGRLVEAARARGRLDVDPSDLSAVVRALRARR